MEGCIEERVVEIARYIVEHKATVRETTKAFGISKSTVHAEVTIGNGLRTKLFG
ncbi:MAG: sporulation transcriptional regulator SpoIIID [Lachnospiraceae bacterium]|nr:sporulation transcriptional regulator SpoIIID [Lachnospiraceae bacterium]